MKKINKILRLLARMALNNTIRQLDSFIDSRNIQNTSVNMNDFKIYGKIVNAGGFMNRIILNALNKYTAENVIPVWEGKTSLMLVRCVIAT